MSELTGLGSLRLQLPSPAYIVGALLFGLTGGVAFRLGRKASKPDLVWPGVALMVYPYAVPVTWALWFIGTMQCGWVYTRWN